MKRFVAAALGSVIVGACGGASLTDITDATGDGGSADGATDGNNSGLDGGAAGDAGGDGGGGNDAGGKSGGDGGGNDGGKACTIDVAGASSGCGNNEYCLSADCAKGICVGTLAHTSNTAYVPQCGCDGVSYWNKEYAAVGGESIASAGACSSSTTPKALLCQTGNCPKGGNACAAQADNCFTLPPSLPEACWSLPVAGQCPSEPQVQSCGAGPLLDGGPQCTSLCAAIDSKAVFSQNASCK